jgi:hypothetical protein
LYRAAQPQRAGWRHGGLTAAQIGSPLDEKSSQIRQHLENGSPRERVGTSEPSTKPVESCRRPRAASPNRHPIVETQGWQVCGVSVNRATQPTVVGASTDETDGPDCNTIYQNPLRTNHGSGRRPGHPPHAAQCIGHVQRHDGTRRPGVAASLINCSTCLNIRRSKGLLSRYIYR